ncbi:MAG: SIMPL domain-containing protein [Bacteroidaceae bacterium]|nr:SIMPL domain-containing protein [Bacteroidaceae bacterium]MBQ3130888.1 SIMPL domain-containing protein [Bacteroidaceae bacterium]MBR3982265.1 SIMPL domain-containing protein [Bacteroidaceae bacterium]MEE0119034.1 SIMPL domain-containing protein [Bacteroidaceae bacterium]
MKNYYVEATILAVAIVVFGTFVKNSLDRFTDKERVVTVKGLSEREVPADKVIWPLIYKELGNDPADIYQRIEKKNATVMDFLKKHGLTDNEISVNPPQVKDRFADSWSQENILNRYVASSVIIVNSTQVDLVRNIMQKQAELMKIGIALISEDYGNNMVKYEFTGLNEIKPEMVEESTKNARATAEKFAKDSDSELGKIRRATQGQFSITNRDNNTPHIKNVRVVSTIEYYIRD